MQGCGPLCGRDEGRGSRGPIQRCPHGNPGSHHIPDASFHSHSKPVTKSFQLHFTHVDSSPGAPGAAQFYDVAATPSSPPPTNAGDPLGWEGSQPLPHGYAVPPLALPGSPRTQWDRTQPCEVGATVIPRHAPFKRLGNAPVSLGPGPGPGAREGVPCSQKLSSWGEVPGLFGIKSKD